MFARIATYRGATSGDLDALLPRIAEEIDAQVADPPPGLEGLREVLLLVDREGGRALGVTFFEDEDALRRGEEVLGRRSASQGGAVRVEIERYEIAVRRERA